MDSSNSAKLMCISGCMIAALWCSQALGEPLLRTLKGHTGTVSALSFSPNGKQALSGSHDQTVRLWDVKTGTALKKFTGHQGAVLSVTFGPDGRYAVSGSQDKTVRVWNLSTGTFQTLRGHRGDVLAVAMGPYGKIVVSASADNTLKVWIARTGQHLRTLKGHTKAVSCVAITPDRKWVISGSRDNTVGIWDLEKGQRVKTLKGHVKGIQALAVGPKGQRAVSASADKRLKLWSLPSGKLLRAMVIDAADPGPPLAVSFNTTSKRVYTLWGEQTLPLSIMGQSQSHRSLENHPKKATAAALHTKTSRALMADPNGQLGLWSTGSRGSTVLKLIGSKNNYGQAALTNPFDGPTAPTGRVAERTVNKKPPPQKPFHHVARPGLKIKKLKQISGSRKVDLTPLKRVLKRRQKTLLYCYESRLKAKPKLQGKVNLKFFIAAAGRITHVNMLSNDTQDKQLARCVKSKIRRWRFPNPTPGSLGLKLQLHFHLRR